MDSIEAGLLLEDSFFFLAGENPDHNERRCSSAIILAVTITRINRRGQLEIEDGRIEEETFEARITNLEKHVNMFLTLLLKEKAKNDGSIRYLEN